MRSHRCALILSLAAALLPGAGTAAPVDELLQAYRRDGAGAFDATAGRAFWNREFDAVADGPPRSCATCHTADPRNAGKHARTGKRIEPVAPSVNPERLSDAREIEKWLGRNCKWTLGRPCTAQEKGDVLDFLKNQ